MGAPWIIKKVSAPPPPAPVTAEEPKVKAPAPQKTRKKSPKSSK
jgi:hypothetical protein